MNDPFKYVCCIKYVILRISKKSPSPCYLPPFSAIILPILNLLIGYTLKLMISEKSVLIPVETELNWAEPIPLIHEYEKSSPYPVQSLPAFIRDAIIAYQQYGKQPLSLIGCSALATISLACQSLANVARDRLLVSPVSLYFLLVAESGERKSSVDYAFSQAIRQWELDTRKNLASQIQMAKTLHQTWFAEKMGVLSQIRRSTLNDENVKELEAQYIQIMAREPVVPLLPELFFEDVTQEALASQIAEGWPSASLWSDEGALVLNSHGMQNNIAKFVALLNRLWDGKPFTSHRKTSKNVNVTNRRLTVSLMLQPLILQQMLSKGGGVNRQSGFMARSLMAFPESSMGERFYQEPPESQAALSNFHQRLIDCLNESLSLDKDGCHKIPTLHFSSQAKSAWISFFNEIETNLSDKWFSIKDFASKAAENTARLSALLHLFSGNKGQLNHEEMQQAIEIIRWHLCETRRIFYSRPKTSQHVDAIKLLGWIVEKAFATTTPRFLQQYSPIREKQRRDKAIQMLLDHQYLRETQPNGKTTLLVNPLTFTREI
jgi:hypothetical protein